MGCHTGEVKQETDISVIDRLEPMFIGDGDFTPAVLAGELKVRMETDKDSVCIITGYCDEELIAFLVCISTVNRHYLWLEQAYNKSGYSDMADEGMKLLFEWAKGTGKHEMRAETSPDHKEAIRRNFRRYDFKEHSIIYALRF